MHLSPVRGKLLIVFHSKIYAYKQLVGSATAQQLIRKNNEAWKSYFALLKKKKKGKLPPDQEVRPPGYWKEYDIRVIEVDESYTFSVCPRCGSKSAVKRKRLFRCLSCGLEAHRDAVGCANIRLAQEGGVVNRTVASPLLLSAEARTSHALA